MGESAGLAVRDLEGRVVVLDTARHAIANAETQDDIDNIETVLAAHRKAVRENVSKADGQRELMRDNALVVFDLYRKGGELLEPFVTSYADAGRRGQAVQSGAIPVGGNGPRYHEKAGIPRRRAERQRSLYLLSPDNYNAIRNLQWDDVNEVRLYTFVSRWQKIKKQREWDALAAREQRNREHEAVITKAEKWAATGTDILHELSNLPHGWPGPCAYDRLMDAFGDVVHAAERFANLKGPKNGTPEA